MATKAEKVAEKIERSRERVADFVALYNQAHLADEDPINDYCVTDILTDLRHYCDSKGWDWAQLVENAETHHNAEIDGEDEFDDDATEA